MDVELEVKAPTKAAAYTIAKKQLPVVMEYLKGKGFNIQKDVDVKAANGYASLSYFVVNVK